MTASPSPAFANERIAFISASWHKDIVDEARKSFISEMEKAGFQASNIDQFSVPGSLEIPLQAQLLAKTGKYSIIVCAGLIVDGGIYRHDFVATSVIDGMMRVQLDTEIPILSVVLTPHHFHDHKDHHDYFFNHFKIKGAEAADACIQTLANMRMIKNTMKIAA